MSEYPSVNYLGARINVIDDVRVPGEFEVFITRGGKEMIRYRYGIKSYEESIESGRVAIRTDLTSTALAAVMLVIGIIGIAGLVLMIAILIFSSVEVLMR